MGGLKIKQSKREAVHAMLRAGKSYRVISNTVDISIGSIHSIAREANEADLNQMVAELKRGNVARHLMLADFLMDELADAVKESTSVKDLAIAAAIMTDKAMLLEKAEEKRLKAKNLALQIGTTVPREDEPLPEELDVLKETPRCPDNAETAQMITRIKAEKEREELEIEQ